MKYDTNLKNAQKKSGKTLKNTNYTNTYICCLFDPAQMGPI